ncbi:hypothetical protein [Solitalea canadensis]|uniref:DUF4440 domain-containing protein n=1 Tax=Solitalea canadensis (strain ATCC 29591 / DSM 3403 / JCM 21819 / LMG 8368 / NBRC 15130 / NCIMB 12057 / USAM 9D) TaxID=929556 RepID=H8KX28_SOLCM|nr:hypothetical protein [Solitalea canadensis]AFD08357.1 hypothetical protein Solca_3350 [Solitalea canadensis DSM 3403]
MKRLIFILLIIFCSNTIFAQSKEEKLDKTIKSLYASISGGAGQVRDTTLIRTLFIADGRLCPIGVKDGKIVNRVLSVSQYLSGLVKLTKDKGFFEKEIFRKTDIFGNMAQVLSTYQSFHNADDREPFQRGINSFQLMYDGVDWKIMNITWNAESSENPIPNKYLE